jgi:hypothetical protein
MLTQEGAANWLRVRGACPTEEQGGHVTGRGDEPLELFIGDGVTPFQKPSTDTWWTGQSSG